MKDNCTIANDVCYYSKNKQLADHLPSPLNIVSLRKRGSARLVVWMALMCLLLLNIHSLHAQTNETFEAQTNNATSFTSNSTTFNLSSSATSFYVANLPGLGYSASNKFIQADDSYGQTGSISSASGTFKVNSFWLYVTGNALQDPGVTSGGPGSVTFTGKLAGVTQFTVVKSSGFATTYSLPGNGFGFINFATEGGTNNTGVAIDKLEIKLSANLDYFAVDNFNWSGSATGPTLTTTAASSVGAKSATLGGNVTADGGATVTERGIVWATTSNPTTSNNKVANGSGTGTFSATVSTLPASTLIYARSYAINSVGTSYGTSVSFTTGAALSAAQSQNNVWCNGGSNATATVTASGGKTPYTYSWSPSGGTGATATGLAVGSYTCTITDAELTQVTKNFTITQPPAFTITTSQTNVACNGASTGSATVNVSGASGPYTYSWSPSGGTAATATGLAAGPYTVTITDANTCQTTRNFTITQPPAFTVTTSQTNVACNGASTGSATVNVSGASVPYTYSWSPSGGTAATATGLAAGPYTVTITDANLCQTTRNFTITQPPAFTVTTSQTNVACNGASTGSATVNVSGASGPYTYSWSPSGGTAATATGLAAGVYTVTIRDANLCQTTRNFTITQPPAFTVTTSQTNVACNGASTGSATVNVSGASGPYTYSWLPSGGTAATATGLAAGAYTVTITDANLCQTTRNFTITQPPAFTVTTSQTNVACNGASTGSATVNVSGASGPYTYSWSPSGGTAATAPGLAAGAYTVTIRDANLCQTTKSFTITQPPAFTVTTSQTNVACNGASTGSATVNVSGASGPYTYSWSPSGGTAATATGLAAGAYTITITDANLCQTTRNFTITQPTAMSVTTSQSNVWCNGGANGYATVTVSGGTGPKTYSWSPSGGTAATATGLVAGPYTVTITDANLCQTTKNFTITQPSAITSSVSSQSNVSTSGGADGSATITASGGTGALTYSWSPSGGTSATATGLTAGTYMVTITDANTCSKTQTVNITQPIAITSSIASQTNVSCNGGANGSATISASGGTGTLSYSWAPSGGTAATATGLAAGTYTVTITDANSVTKTQSVTITQPSAIASSVSSQTNVSCNGGSNGAATITASGGTGTLSYSWSPSGGTAATATGLAAGTYYVTITDANSCSKIQKVTITQSTAITSSVSSQTNVACNGGSNGAATITASGGTGTLSYSWSPSGGTAATATGLTAGTYTVTITDANSCTKTQTVTITQPSAIASSVSSQTNVACNGGSNGAATITASGGTGTLSYSWSPSGGTAATATGLTAGTYTVIITDANSCTKTQTVTITQPPAIASSISSQTNVACHGGSNGAATIAASGGTGTLSYSWSPSGGTAATATGLAAGTYYVTVTDANSCSKIQKVTITQPTAITASISSQTNVSCNGGSNGAATLTASGGTGTLSYSWSPSGGTAAAATGLAPGTYTCTITDANTCQTTQSVTITQPAAITVTATPASQTICDGQPTNIALNSAPAGADFNWTVTTVSGNVTGATSASGSSIAQVLTRAGMVKYTITPVSNSCTGSAKEVLVTVNALTTVEIHPSDKSIYDEETAKFAIEANNATGYQWQVNSGSGFTDIADDAHYTGTSTYILKVSNATGDMNGNLYRCVATGNCAPVYSNSATLTVKVRTAQTISFAATSNKTYGDDDFTPAASTTAGLQLSYSSSDESVATIQNGKIHIKKVGQTTITASQAGDDDYKPATSVDQVLTINKKSITLSLNATPAIGKTYDRNTDINLAAGNYALSEVEEGDDVTVQGTASFENEKAGDNKNIDVADFVLSGASAGNYVLSNNKSTVKGTIKRAAIVVSLHARPLVIKTYNGSDVAILDAANYSLQGVLGEDDVKVASSKAMYSDKKAGADKEVTATEFVLDGNEKDNYIIGNESAVTSGDIKAKEITARLAATPYVSKVYDGNDKATIPGAKYQLDGIETGDDVSVKGTALYNNRHAGEDKAVTVNELFLQGDDAANYQLSTTELSGTGSIEKAMLSVTVVKGESGIAKEYDGKTEAILAPDNYSVQGVIGEDHVQLNNPTKGSYDNKHGGDGKKVTVDELILMGEDADNYTLESTTVSANIGRITRKVVGVSADAKTKLYGEADPTLTYTTEGVLEGDVLQGALSRTEGKNVGEYKVQQGTLEGGDDYLIEWFQNASFTITPAALTITAEDKTKKQGAANPTLTVHYNGLTQGDRPTDLETPPVVTTTATTSSQMGYYDIEVSGAASGNYNISYVKGKLTIKPATDATYSVKVWSPNPNQLQIKIYTEKAQKAAIILYTETGQQVVLQQQQLTVGVNSFTMSVAPLASSTYILGVNAEQFKDAQKVKVK